MSQRQGTNRDKVVMCDSGWSTVPSTSIHIVDVARLHVEALNPKIEGGQSFLAVSEGARYMVGGGYRKCE